VVNITFRISSLYYVLTNESCRVRYIPLEGTSSYGSPVWPNSCSLHASGLVFAVHRMALSSCTF